MRKVSTKDLVVLRHANRHSSRRLYGPVKIPGARENPISWIVSSAL